MLAHILCAARVCGKINVKEKPVRSFKKKRRIEVCILRETQRNGNRALDGDGDGERLTRLIEAEKKADLRTNRVLELSLF